MSNRRHSWSREEADRIVDALESSGLSVAEFARQHDIVPHRLYWARRRRQPATATTSDQAPFAELAVVAEPGLHQSPIELRVPSGISLLVTRDFDEVTLRRLLDLVGPC